MAQGSYDLLLSQVDKALAQFSKVVDSSQKALFEEIHLLVSALEKDKNGNIKTTISNMQQVVKIKAKIGNIVISDAYRDGVSMLMNGFDLVYRTQKAYYKKSFQAGTIGEIATKKQKLLRQLAVQNTIEGLTGAGIQAQITDKIGDMLMRSVTSGAKWTDMVSEMKAYLDPDGDGTGAFAKYAKTYATTAMGQFTGQNNKLMTDALDTEWYMYVGSDIETTREFCLHLTKKRYIHVSEIPTILEGHIDGHDCAIYKKTGLPQGMIEGTTPENFQVNVGGWNCRHQLLPVAAEAVPADIRRKYEKRSFDTLNSAGENLIPTKKKSVEKVNDIFSHVLNDKSLFPNGYVGFESVSKESAYMTTDSSGLISINFATDNRGFNAGEALLSAIDKINKSGESANLNYKEEYSLEAVWHEILHNKSGNKTILPEITSVDGFDRVALETCHQLYARSTYNKLCSEIGYKEKHKDWIIENGYGYHDMVKNLRMLLHDAHIDESIFLSRIEPLLMQDYKGFRQNVEGVLKDLYKGKSDIVRIFEMLEICNYERFTKNLA